MNIKKESSSLWVMCIFLTLLTIILTVAVIVMNGKINDLQGQINANRSARNRNWDYIWDITEEIQGEPLQSENGNPYENDDVSPSRIDDLYEEIWGEAYLRELDADNQTFKDCGHTTMMPGCPDSRIDLSFDELFVDPESNTLTAPSVQTSLTALSKSLLHLFDRSSNIVKAICEIHPETLPLCAQ